MPDRVRETVHAPDHAPRDLRDVIFDSTGEGIVVADECGRFLVWNRAATELCGVGAADVPPERWSAHYRLTAVDGTPIPTDQLPLVRAIHGESVDDFDLLIHNRRSGRKLLVSCYARPLRDDADRLIGGVVVFRDVTERRRIEKELESFARTISHDLKDPLAGIIGLVKVLQASSADRLDDTAREHVDQIASCAERMGKLIDDLLDHCRIGANWRAMAAVDLEPVVEAAIESLVGEIRRTGAVVHVRKPLPVVHAHRSGLEQALRNLIGNALKFVAPGSVPEVEIGCEEDSNSWRLWVRDRGIGIDPKFHGVIFDVFRRLHGRDRYEGTGIGLAIVKKIAELHQGDVGVDSVPGEGSTFWLRLPKRDPADNGAKEPGR